MTDDLTPLRTATYVLLTTFRKNGTPVPTPVWAAAVGDELLVWTEVATGKVKRIRRDGRVTIAPCNFRGTAKGPAIETRARLLADEGVARTQAAIEAKYGLLGRIFTRGTVRFRGADSVIGIAVSLADAASRA